MPTRRTALTVAAKDVSKRSPDPPRQGAIVHQAQVSLQTGPLPSPEQLEKYELVCPGLALRLALRMEMQSDHRMALEARALEADIRSRYLGQWLAAFIAIAFLLGGCYFAATGHPVEGSVVAGGS